MALAQAAGAFRWATPRNPENNQSAAGAPEAKASNDAGFEAAREAENQRLAALQKERPAFEVRETVGDWSWRIFASGRIEGFPLFPAGGLVVLNRIPQLLAEARARGEARGWAEAVVRGRHSEGLTSGELRLRHRGVWFSGWRNGFGLAASIAVLLALLADLLAFH